ncbi:HAMP domain-containing histidine kinase [Actinoplanes sp. LDG1-06]|uniref:histidine kinase n=1 Tax=Paractinoplanes ovalisporus TaxID=2810368 RepID=A0ABS2AIZ8_9ACTN|nr:HAMP domain-containing sensor histidine kinase [Actinoplanes ovalisporus]MBM2619801.1 HAMP domain-containing histidine kinase [Actinoplanes ovalisporus]
MGVRTRYTLLYGTMFLLSGLGLLTIVAALSLRDTRQSAPVGGMPVSEQVAALQRELADSGAAATRQLLVASFVALLVMLVFSLVMGHAAAGRVLRPLRAITAATRRITADNLHSRLAVHGPSDEVKDLADTIDDLLVRLEESFAAQRRFVADASHELRTPLATMRASLDVALAKPDPVPAPLATRLRSSLDEMDAMLDGLLLLARAQHGALDNREPVDLAALAEEALAARAEQIKIKPVSPYVLQPATLPTLGNPVLLARLVGNIIDNAVTHNVPGGGLWISGAISNAVVVLTVESDGPMLDESELARLGRPFHRIAPVRTGPGTGLGLAIVAAVTAAHGGALDLTPRPTGGLRLSVSLPAAPS